MSKRPTVTLCMICKNESHIIEECLRSMVKYIDYWVICDTGSTDGTQDLIRKFFEKAGIPGELHQHKWHDFGTNRSMALALCDGKADYAWMIDADDFVKGEFKYPSQMDADAYLLKINRGSFEWWRNQIFRTGVGWCYIGSLHEYAHVAKPNPNIHRIDGNYAIEARTLGGRNVGITPVEKYAKDAILLEKEMKKEPDNARYQFYLAQSYFDSHQWAKAAEAYKKRASMNGWQEEVYYSLFRVAICDVNLQKDWMIVHSDFLTAWSYRPIRAEPLYELSRLYRAAGQPRLAYLYARAASNLPFPAHDILFIENDVYRWKVIDEVGATAFFVHDFMGGYQACKHLLDNKLVPPNELERVRTNFAAYEQKLKETGLSNPGVNQPHHPWTHPDPRRWSPQAAEVPQQLQQPRPIPVPPASLLLGNAVTSISQQRPKQKFKKRQKQR